MLTSIQLRATAPTHGYPWDLPAVRFISHLHPHPRVTFLVGDNGTGKSTLMEAIAVVAGFNPEGGNQNYRFSTRVTESPLHRHLELAWRGRPAHGWFLRAETFYNLATFVDDNVSAYFAGHSFHSQSHGESFIDLALARFHPGGFYLLDEPESALSFQGCLRMLAVIHDRAQAGAQFMIATHSPLLMSYPAASIFELSSTGVEEVGYEEVETVQLWRNFLESPDRFIRHLLAAEPDQES